MTYKPPQRTLSRRSVLQLALLALTGCAMPGAGAVPTPTLPVRLPSIQATPHFSGINALEHASLQMQWVPRDPGTEGWRLCGDYIRDQMKQIGLQVEEQTFDYKGITCRNLIGKRGTGPLFLLVAHYDSRRRSDQETDEKKRALPVPAANDGASGIGVLLELARVLKPEELGHTIWFVAVDAEDQGDLDGWDWIVGSSYVADHLPETPQGMIVLDMIGDADQQIYYEYNSSKPMMEGIWKVAAELGYKTFKPEYRYSMEDDHTPFVRRGIPAVDLIDFDYPHWHRTTDTLDRISVASMEAVGRTLEEWFRRGMPGVQVSDELPHNLWGETSLFGLYGCQERAILGNSTG